jgi:hypothetical protein
MMQTNPHACGVDDIVCSPCSRSNLKGGQL